MKKLYEKAFLQVASPTIGNDVRRLVGEVATLVGVARVAPSSRASNLLRIDYDPALISMRTLLTYARRGWATVRRVGMQRRQAITKQSTPACALQMSHVIPT
jgi:hypothetical protein